MLAMLFVLSSTTYAASITGQVWSGATVCSPAVESPHPYDNNVSLDYQVTHAGSSKIRVHFAKIVTESAYDWIRIMDANNVEIIKYSGTLNDVWTPWVTGDTLKIRLTSDNTNNYYGFLVDKYATDDTITGIPGVVITRTGSTTTTTTAADGSYSFTGLADGTYGITPSMAGKAFSPTTSSVPTLANKPGVADFEKWDDHITSVTANPSPFTPTGANSTTITAVGTPGKTGLYAKVTGTNVEQNLPLAEGPAGTYTATWDGMDHSTEPGRICPSGTYTVKIYGSDLYPFTKSTTVVLNSISAVSATPTSFYPSAAQTTLIKVTGSTGLSLETRVVNATSGTEVKVLSLVWNSTSSTYNATWDGRNESGVVQPAGAYELRIYSPSGTASPGGRYITSGSVTVAATASITAQAWTGAAPMPTIIESAHPYANSFDYTWSFTAPSGTKTRVHIGRMTTESGYDYVRILDANNVELAKYSGSQGDIWSPWVTGNTVKIRFTSDTSTNGYGFQVDKFVTDDILAGVKDVTVTVSPGNLTAKTGTDGNCTIAGLMPSTYTVTPSTTDAGVSFSPLSSTVTLAAGQTASVAFERIDDHVTSVSVSPNPYTMTGETSATITVVGKANVTGMFAKVVGTTSETRVDLAESSTPGTYTGSWYGLDAQSLIVPPGSFTVKVYDKMLTQFSKTATFTTVGVTSVTATPGTIYGLAGQSTTISVIAAPSLQLEVRVVNSGGYEIVTLPLTWDTSTGIYKAVWNNTYGVLPGNYELRVYNKTNVANKHRYTATGVVIIAPAAAITGHVWAGGAPVTPIVESAHPYLNNGDVVWTINSVGGTKTRIHFEKIETEFCCDHVYLEDANHAVVADYRGNYLDLWTPWVPGNTVYVRLTSNFGNTGYGLVADRYETDANSDGIEGVAVTITPGGSSATTGPDGSFTISNLLPGTYTVTPAKIGWDFDPASASLTIAAGALTNVDFKGIGEGDILDSIAEARQRPDGWSVGLPFSPVAGTFADCFYLEEATRFAGIRVNSSTPVLEGNLVRIFGRLSTVGGERILIPHSVNTQPDAQITYPLGMPNKILVGDGIGGASGLNNSGLLVRIWGKVSDPGTGGFYVDDGSSLVDVTGHKGVWVSTVSLYSGRTMTLPAIGKWVAVTGVAASRSQGVSIQRIIRPRSQSDIQIIK